ncbi:MAG: hypothetical protein M1839_006338 [Geoglossum umbratile]|nr:MAG: hypothetical protein M1839_006338 [Geoglossum umbratile]
MKTSESTSRDNSHVSSNSMLPGSAEKSSLAKPSQSLSGPAQRAYGIIKDGRGPNSPWIRVHLEPGDITMLKERLEEEDLWGYVRDKIRFDYDRETRTIVFRLPSTVHEIFTGQVVREIESQLKRISEDESRPNIAAIAGSIVCEWSADIYVYGPNRDHKSSMHSPDASFMLQGAGYPCIVVETSYSQKEKDLPCLADDYIVGSLGNIKVVIGLDIEFEGSKKATVSVWHSVTVLSTHTQLTTFPILTHSEVEFEDDETPYLYAKKTMDDILFRNSDGSPVSPSNAALRLPFSTFLPSGTALSADVALSITFTTLLSFVEYAERM